MVAVYDIGDSQSALATVPRRETGRKVSAGGDGDRRPAMLLEQDTAIVQNLSPGAPKSLAIRAKRRAAIAGSSPCARNARLCVRRRAAVLETLERPRACLRRKLSAGPAVTMTDTDCSWLRGGRRKQGLLSRKNEQKTFGHLAPASLERFGPRFIRFPRLATCICVAPGVQTGVEKICDEMFHSRLESRR
jgi:hypothetical protein